MRLTIMLGVLALLTLATDPALAQGQGKGAAATAKSERPGKGPKRYVVKTDRALVVTREVLVKRGFLVERVEDKGDFITVWYYRGNMGRGKGKGPLQTMIIRRIDDRVLFERAPADVMVDIDVRLKL